MFTNIVGVVTYLAVGVWLVQYMVSELRTRPLMQDPDFLRMFLICVYITGVLLWPVYAVVYITYVACQVAKSMFNTLILGNQHTGPKHRFGDMT